MLAPNFKKFYSIPKEIEYPETPENLRLDTNYPNLNTGDYTSRPATKCENPPFFDFIDRNSNENVIIAANDFLSREPDSVIYGYAGIKNVQKGPSLFEFRRESTITGMHFLRHNLIMLALENGNVEMWSTRCDNSEVDKYCPFKLTGKSKHLASLTASGFLGENNSKFITGDQRGTVIVWDTGAADIDLKQNYKMYGSEVTGICASSENENLFLSCSNHGESFITDIRTSIKGTVLKKDEEAIFTNILAKENYIFIGDFGGNLKVLDQRKTNEEVKILPLFENSIKKIKLSNNGKSLAIIERGTGLKVVSTDSFETIYEAKEKSSLRDALWNDDTSLHVIGWNSLFKSHYFGLLNGK